MRRTRTCLYTASLLIGSLLPQQSVADFIMPIGERSDLGSPASGTSVLVPAFNSRSFCCTLFNSTSSGQPTFSGVGNFDGLASDAADSLKDRGLSGNATGPAFTAARRKCWHESPTPGSSALRELVLGQPGTAQPVEVLCEETSLIGGFNTSVTDFNFLELSASTESGGPQETISGYVILTTTVNPERFEIPFALEFNGATNLRQDIAIHDLLNGEANFGQVLVIHNAAPGVLKARVTQYRIVTVQPLDFEPVLQEILVPNVTQ